MRNRNMYYPHERQEAERKAREVAEKILLRGDPAFHGILADLERRAIEIHPGLYEFPDLQKKKIAMDESEYLDFIKKAYMAGFAAAACWADVENMLIHHHKAGSPWIETHFKYK